MHSVRTAQQAEHSMLSCKHGRTQHLENPKIHPKNPNMHPENPKMHLENPKPHLENPEMQQCILIICKAAFSSCAKQATDLGQHSSLRFEKRP